MKPKAFYYYLIHLEINY